jgi:tRNA (guanine-N7-)-methyltransferase
MTAIAFATAAAAPRLPRRAPILRPRRFLARACASQTTPARSPAAAPRQSLQTPAELRARYEILTPADCARAAAAAAAHAGPALARWRAARPVAAHTQRAFARVAAWRAARPAGRPLVLDLGCGTGRSSAWIARGEAGCDVVGVDRNAALVGKSAAFVSVDEGDREGERPPARAEVPGNVIVVRAEQGDFLRLADEAGWRVAKAYVLYPSPYPKPAGLKSRLYGSPVFPLLVGLLAGGGSLEARASWPAYLEELTAAAVALAPGAVVDGPRRFFVAGPDRVVSNFEEKYHRCGLPVYRVDIAL